MSKSETADAFPVRVDFERILETIAARIYDNPAAFLRENVQNAIDAVRMQARRDGKPPDDPEYEISITVSGSDCSIADNGIGMTKDELKNNFWTMGASGKNTDEARAAGCIGTFGIGGFANFGVCETLEVTSRPEQAPVAHQTSLSRAAFGEARFNLPTVACTETQVLSSRGTVVKGIGREPFNAAELQQYITQFVRHVRERVTFGGKKLSQAAFDAPSSSKRPLGEPETRGGLKFRLWVDGDDTISAELLGAQVGNREIECSGQVRLQQGPLDVFKRGFRLCTVSVPSRIGVSGWIDTDSVRPTAGRDTLDAPSTSLLTSLFQRVEAAAKEHILRDPDLLAGHIRLVPDFLQEGLLEKLGALSVELVGGNPKRLDEIRALPRESSQVFFTTSGDQTAVTEVLLARGHIIVKLSGNRQRRPAETEYLQRFCGAQQLDGMIDCLEPYVDLDLFERSVLSELDFCIRKLFKPPTFKLSAGKLTLDAPIYWTKKRDNDAVIVLVDTRHGEFQKLRPLAHSSLFYSMVEAFCREYLSSTLRRESVKLFGSGALDLDAFSKANSETWELVLNDIEVSKIGIAEPAVRTGGGRTVVMTRGDIAQVTISHSGGVSAAPAENTNEGDVQPNARKLLHIVDKSGSTNLSGFYLRIPETATSAFGSIIRTLPTFAVVWFANRITWQGCDPGISTAFLFDVTLDQLVAGGGSGAAAYGSIELAVSQVQTYEGQIYFWIPPELEDRIIPRQSSDLIKIQLRHELVDLSRARAWTAKESA